MRYPRCKRTPSIGIMLLLVSTTITVAGARTNQDQFWPYWTEYSGLLFGEIGQGSFVEVDVADGAIKWEFRDGLTRHFTRTVFDDGAAFTAVETSDSNSQLLSLNLATGRPEWKASFVNLAGNASPVQCGAVLLLPDFWSKTVSAFEMRTGTLVWRTDHTAYSFVHPPVVLTQGTAMYLAYRKDKPDSPELLTLECSNGHVVSTAHVSDIGISRNPLLLTNEGLLRFGYEGPPPNTKLEMIDLHSLSQRWSVSIPDEIARFTPSLSKGVMVAGGSSVWVVDLATGGVKFRFRLPRPTVPIAVYRNRVFFSGGDSSLTAVDLSTGRRLWKTRLRGHIASNVNVVGERIVVAIDLGQLAVLDSTGRIEKYINITEAAHSVADSSETTADSKQVANQR